MKEILICDCNSTEHQMVFMTVGDEHPRECYVHVHLTKKRFLDRVKTAFRHIMGYKSRFGDWDEFILNPEDADKLQKVVDFLRDENRDQ